MRSDKETGMVVAERVSTAWRHADRGRKWKREYHLCYYRENRDHILERENDRYRRKRESINAKRRGHRAVYGYRRGQAIKRDILTHYGGGTPACVWCEESNMTCLSIDHINGRGSEHRKALFGSNKSSVSFYLWLRCEGYPREYRTLCMNCQFKETALARSTKKRPWERKDEREEE